MKRNKDKLRHRIRMFVLANIATILYVSRPQDILSLAEEKLEHTSSTALCRKLSSIGRRVLSIESVATFQGLPLGIRYLCVFLFKNQFLL